MHTGDEGSKEKMTGLSLIGMDQRYFNRILTSGPWEITSCRATPDCSELEQAVFGRPQDILKKPQIPHQEAIRVHHLRSPLSRLSLC